MRMCSCRKTLLSDSNCAAKKISATDLLSKHILDRREEKAMMGGRSWDDWIEEYSESHQHPINRLTHTFGIPMIAVSIVLLPFGLLFPRLWLVIAALFVVGWVLQFIGHHYEGKPPEF